MPSRATKFRFHSLRQPGEDAQGHQPQGRDRGDEDHLVDSAHVVPSLCLCHPPAHVVEQGLKVKLLVDSQQEQQDHEHHPEDRAAWVTLADSLPIGGPDQSTSDRGRQVSEHREPANRRGIADAEMPVAPRVRCGQQAGEIQVAGSLGGGNARARAVLPRSCQRIASVRGFLVMATVDSRPEDRRRGWWIRFDARDFNRLEYTIIRRRIPHAAESSQRRFRL